MRSVRMATRQALPNVRFTDRAQAGAYGAAAFAAFAHRATDTSLPADQAAAGPTQHDLDLFTTRQLGSRPMEEKTA